MSTPLLAQFTAAGLLGFAGLLALGLLLAWCILVIFTARRLTRPPRRGTGYAIIRSLPEDPAKLTLATGAARFTYWPLRTADGLDLPVWDITGENPSGPIIIFSHGWGESRWFALSRFAALAPHCSRFICYDLRSHGESPAASRCLMGTREVDDLLALVDIVQPLAAPGPQLPLVLYGFSLGSGVSIAAAADPRLKGRVSAVIAEAPYRLPQTPASAVMRLADMPWRSNVIPAIWLAGLLSGSPTTRRATTPNGTFDRAVHAARLSVPLTVIHGQVDAISPPIDGQAIAAAAGPHGRFIQISGAGHIDLWQPPFASAAAEAVTAALGRIPALASGAASYRAPA